MLINCTNAYKYNGRRHTNAFIAIRISPEGIIASTTYTIRKTLRAASSYCVATVYICCIQMMRLAKAFVTPKMRANHPLDTQITEIKALNVSRKKL